MRAPSSCAALAAAVVCTAVALPARAQPAADLARQRARAARVEILRDRWGVPHVYGRTDADAVFGLVYAQAEDDFARVELNYVDALGRRAEVDGEGALWRDLRARLYVEPADLRARYAASPAWLRALMDAWADGLNFYLATHPAVRPKLLTRFEPWMALSFTEGSIGGDLEEIGLGPLAAFYGPRTPGAAPNAAGPEGGAGDGPPPVPEPTGSNGFAIAPSRTAAGHALLLINPHTSFYFRPEVHVVSGQGLNAYGAVTWGQFFVYQGFNDRAGWMHTSGGGDVVDEYVEAVTERAGRRTYRYDGAERPVTARRIALAFRRPDGTFGRREVTAYFTHHGPVVRADSAGRWVTVRLMYEPVRALQQSYLRTKARSYADFARVMALRTNSSNNTVYADADGTIAYWHGDFLPRRDPRVDWTRPVDGTTSATEWRGLHALGEIVSLKNPRTGWIQNTNNWPFSAAGPASPSRERFPAYMWTLPENPRGVHAVRVLSRDSAFTLDGLIAAAYDPALPAFEGLLPPLFAAYDALPAGDAQRARLAGPVAALRGWDLRWAAASVPTSVAVFWGDRVLAQSARPAAAAGQSVYDYAAARLTPAEQLAALDDAVARLAQDFGTWETPWGEINRFQRLSGAPGAGFDDAKPSWPVPFTSATWGSLASIGQRGPRTTRRFYGTYGNSFVAAVEFGPRVRARSVLAGGVSADSTSPHFVDQAPLYAAGRFKDVAFYREDVERQAERRYRPGS